MTSFIAFSLVPALVAPMLSLLSMVGIGSLFLYFTLGRNDGLSRPEMLTAALALGMLVCSHALLFTSVLGVFGQVVGMSLRLAGLSALALAFYLYRPRFTSLSLCSPSWVPIAFVAALCGLFIVSTFMNATIHGDAMQYHLASPWLIGLQGRLVWNETLLHSGTYLGYDLLYLTVGDLSGLVDSPSMIDRVKLFNALTDSLFPVSVFLLCRAFGGSKGASSVAALAVFTLGPITYWGLLKNDIAAATLGLVTLTVLVRAHEKTSESLLMVASALAAYAVGVKITTAIPLAIPFAYVYLSKRFTIKTCILSMVIGSVLLLPWMVYAYVAQGNPLAPIGGHLPQEIKQAWDARNSNGIDASPLNFVTMFVPILLGHFQISGNESLGILSIIAIALVLIGLVRDISKGNWNILNTVVASSLVWLMIFYTSRYDNRFLSRYVLISIAIFFAFISAKFTIYARETTTRVRLGIFVAAIAVVCVLIGQNPSIAQRYQDLAKFRDGEQTAREKEAGLSQYSAPYRAIEGLRKPGDAIAINDGAALFLKPPFFNLHALHLTGINLYKKDAGYVRRYLSDRSVTMLLFRKGISGGTKAVDDFMTACAQELQMYGSDRVLYAVRPSCK